MKRDSVRVGEIRPSQLMYTYGVGAIVDLPKLSVIVTGIEDWPTNPEYAKPIDEERLLRAVQTELPSVKKLIAAPIVPQRSPNPDPFSTEGRIGVTVEVFPRWMVCPMCHLLAHVRSGLFTLKTSPYAPDKTTYRHETCTKGNKPEVIPARFLIACEAGHLDDFPWIDFVHYKEGSCASPTLYLEENTPSGEARDLEVRCSYCKASRRLSDAFGEDNRHNLPMCRGRRPHLRDFEPEGCGLRSRAIILGASNTWFPVILSTVAIPAQEDRLAQLVESRWSVLKTAKMLEMLDGYREIGQLGVELSQFSDDQIWKAIEQRRKQGEQVAEEKDPRDLKAPEWQVFTNFNPRLNSDEFRLQHVESPERYADVIEEVTVVERLREVQAMIGFTRIDTVGELTDPEQGLPTNPAPISRFPPEWVPSMQTHGEGIFLKFRERTIREWERKHAVYDRRVEFLDAHIKWRAARRIPQPENGFPGMRYVFLHSFSHALMRQLALECGYSGASLKERIYSRPPEQEGGPMAGLLIYTAAPDSEGTLGGLISLAQPKTLERHIGYALETARLCASDPLCAERTPGQNHHSLHASACHACLFVPETSCERGNKYLDRSTLVRTVERDDLAFFRKE